ncbi:MAG TPA: sulfatase-like hydrolase/transferase, partial [Verrucomicrobiaceae bacterium]
EFGTKDIRTPNIDRLFKEGMGFENFRASCCVCSPTRAALLTGRYPDRVGVPGVIRDRPGQNWGFLSPAAVLLPQVLKPAGYYSAIVGKWHLGLESPNTPNERGFDFFHGFLGDMMDDYWTHLRNGHNFMRQNQETVDPKGHATDVFTDWACEYIEQRAKSKQPWFLYLAYNAPHGPVQPPPDWLEKVRQRESGMSEVRAKYVALVEHLDAGIGRVLALLDTLKLAENTLVIFSSDNGGVLSQGANNGPWRSEKTHVYDGGLRVPCAARWPAKIKAGTVTTRTAVTMDIFPTICEASGASPPANIEGVSFLPTVLGQEQPEAGRFEHFTWREGGARMMGLTIEALREGDWMLVHDSPFAPPELFNLKDDPYEAFDLSKKAPQKFNELRNALQVELQKAGSVPWQKP